MILIPSRVIIAIMIFTACWQKYMLQLNMSINIVAMVKHKPVPIKNETRECSHSNSQPNKTRNSNPDYGVRYEWTSVIEGYIMGAFYYGYILICIPGGFLAERYGPRLILGLSTILCSLITLVTPLAASIHYGIVIGLRFFLGIFSGTLYPCLYCLISKWAPTNEKGKFLSALMGGTLSTVVSWPMSGLIINHLGWVFSFYITGIIALVWSIFWIFIVYDSPDLHPTINQKEKDYIMDDLGNNITFKSDKKRVPPYFQIFCSVPFYALLILHFGNLWGLYFLMNSGPKFLSEALGFNIITSSLLNSIPHVARLIMGFVFGSIGDCLRKNEILTVTHIRKFFCIFSHIIPGILLFCMLVVGCNEIALVVIMTLSLGINGATTITNLMNPQDLAPNFAGTLYGIINSFGSIAGVLCPALIGYTTRKQSTLREWYVIFSIGASIYIISALVFILFGSGDVQKWNAEIDTKEKE